MITFTDSFEIVNADAYTDVSAVSSAVVCYRLGAEPLEYDDDGETMIQKWYGIDIPVVNYVKTVSPDDPSRLRFTCHHTVSIPNLMDNGVKDVFVPVQPVITTVLTFTTSHETKNVTYEKLLDKKDLVFRPVGNPVIEGLSCTIENEDSFAVGEVTQQDSSQYFSNLGQLGGGRYYARLNLFTNSISMNIEDYYETMAYPIYTIFWKDLAATEHTDEYDSYVYRYQDVWDINKMTSRLIWNITKTPIMHDFVFLPFWDMKDLKHPFIEGHTYDVYVRMELSVCGMNNINYHTEEHVTNTIVETPHKTLTFVPDGALPDLDIRNRWATIDNDGIFGIKSYDPENGVIQCGAVSAVCRDGVYNYNDFGSAQNGGGVGLQSNQAEVVVFYRKVGEEAWNEEHTVAEILHVDESDAELEIRLDNFAIPYFNTTANIYDFGDYEVKVQFTYTIEYGVDDGHTTHTKQIQRTTNIYQLEYKFDDIHAEISTSFDDNFNIRIDLSTENTEIPIKFTMTSLPPLYIKIGDAEPSLLGLTITSSDGSYTGTIFDGHHTVDLRSHFSNLDDNNHINSLNKITNTINNATDPISILMNRWFIYPEGDPRPNSRMDNILIYNKIYCTDKDKIYNKICGSFSGVTINIKDDTSSPDDQYPVITTYKK